MKKFILALFITAMVASQAQAATFYRVIVDLPFTNVNHALALMNLVEEHKDKVMASQSLEGISAVAKMVGSWDTEFVNHSEFPIYRVNFAADSVVYGVPTVQDAQATIDARNAWVVKKQAQLDEIKAANALMQADID